MRSQHPMITDRYLDMQRPDTVLRDISYSLPPELALFGQSSDPLTIPQYSVTHAQSYLFPA